jgi:hypothetical protein
VRINAFCPLTAHRNAPCGRNGNGCYMAAQSLLSAVGAYCRRAAESVLDVVMMARKTR